MNHEIDERPLTTVDLAAATQTPQRPPTTQPRDLRDSADDSLQGNVHVDRGEERELMPLFMPEVAGDFRSRWDAIQIGFVDDPTLSVRSADELVAQVMKSLAETFSRERTELEAQFNGSEESSTENLRVALCRYRSFFRRLLSL